MSERMAFVRTALEKLARVGRRANASNLTSEQSAQLAHLREHGYVMFDHLVGTERLKQLQEQYRKRIEEDLNFEFPTLAQSRIDPTRDADLIKSNFLATPHTLAQRGLTFDRKDVKSYGQAVAEYEPSTLTTELPDTGDWLDLWLDPNVLPIAEAYFGFVPQMVEAYIRRNFPARFVVMNHAWHRDRNHETHLLKAFVFLSDCTLKTGPHHYIAGSVSDRRIDGKIYYSDDEIRSVYPESSGREIISVVPAGTIILEDTRGLHKAGMPDEGYRDLGYSTFVPPIALLNRGSLYKVSRKTFDKLTPAQQRYIPPANIVQ
ncbi:hypothetical protein ABIB57_004781 [Devosia sp. UYZn731]|uniref:hypothetical protein n=1 Tax=Devosia sp. UYZn731 TaxID=3156345 RepID=UPI00339B7810